jgi:hypothetical protein
MSTDTNNTAPTGTRKSMEADEISVLISRIAGTPGYCAPVFLAMSNNNNVTVRGQCLPGIVVKRDNISDKEGNDITVAQCTWTVLLDVTFPEDIDTATAFRTACDCLLAEGKTALVALPSAAFPSAAPDRVSVYYALNSVGVSPAKARAEVGAAISAVFSHAGIDDAGGIIADGVTGEAPKRASADVTGKVNAAINVAQATALAAMVAAGVNAEVASYLSRGESLPEGWTMAGPPAPTAPGRK